MKKLIYITEDEENIRELLECTLNSFSYDTRAFESGEEMFEALDREIPDLFILDLMLPGISGIDILKKLKAQKKYKDVPVIILTAKSSETDKVTGLDVGADDYITKPFGILEFTARVRAAIRRNEKSDIITGKDIEIDSKKHQVFKNGCEITLTLKEYQLLSYLMEKKNEAVSRETLLDVIWGIDYIGETRTLDMHIKSLRRKIGDRSDEPVYIKTVRGVGYSFIG